MAYRIEKAIPLPVQRNGRAAKSELRQALESLEIGDSVQVLDRTAKEARNDINRSQKLTGSRYILRTLSEGVRIWRIE